MKGKEIAQFILTLNSIAPMDACFVGVIDFNEGTFQTLKVEMSSQLDLFINDQPLPNNLSKKPTSYYFDLASLTKPLTNSLSYFLNPEIFSEEMMLCLNHRAGLPAWGLLSSMNWKEQILSYPIQESSVLYSDFSALRVMLELEKKNMSQQKMCSTIWDEEVKFWKDLPKEASLLPYGFRNGRKNLGVVHDPNAYLIQTFCSHAGLFATLEGVCRTLLHWNHQLDLLFKMSSILKTDSHHFVYGWDRVENTQSSLAGEGCSPLTFGHLGFTGTSLWIDPQKNRGHVILSNATKDHWFDKAKLNLIRKKVGKIIWS